MKYKFNCIGSLLFLRIYHLGVNLSGLDICLVKHLADGKKVCTLSKLVRGVRMSEAMEGYLIFDACCFNPSFNWLIYPRWRLKTFKYQSIIFTWNNKFADIIFMMSQWRSPVRALNKAALLSIG